MLTSTSPSADARRQQPVDPSTARTERWAIVDVARGVALIGMGVFHFAWDLDVLGLAPGLVSGRAGWSALAHVVAGSFLALVGVSLVLAAGKGLDRRSTLRRLGTITLGAGLVSLATRFAVPDAPVTFGILHCIAVSSVLALPFLRAPASLVIGAAVACLMAPRFLRGEALDPARWWWLGLSVSPPDAVDFVPLLPWFGAVLAGVAGARLLLPVMERRGWRAWRPRAWALRALALAGRHSLLVYLVHQPLLIGVVSLAALVLGALPPTPLPAPPEAMSGVAFVASCEAGCARSGAEVSLCERRCGCVGDRMRAETLWERALGGRLTAGEVERVGVIARSCAAADPSR